MKDYLTALGYPFRGHGRIITIISIILCWVSVFGGAIILTSYFTVFFMKMVQSSGMGEDDLCDFPSPYEGWIDSIILPYFRISALILVSFGPCALAVWQEWPDATVFILGLLGYLYFPMAFLRVALTESFHGMSPIGWWQSVSEIPWPYAKLTAFSTLVITICAILPEFYPAVFISRPIQFILICISMNILGKFYRKHEDAFAW